MSIQAKLLEMKRLMIEKKKIGSSPPSEVGRSESTPEPAADPRRDEQKIVQSAEPAPLIVEPAASPQEVEPVEKIPPQQPVKDSPSPDELEQGEAVEERASNPIDPPAQDPKPLPNPPLNPQKPTQNLQLAHTSCMSYSIEQDIRHNLTAVQQKSKELVGESKSEKKQKKIVLKELTKIKECIRNLQGVVKGLEYIEGRVKHNPSMRTTIRSCLIEMNALCNV